MSNTNLNKARDEYGDLSPFHAYNQQYIGFVCAECVTTNLSIYNNIVSASPVNEPTKCENCGKIIKPMLKTQVKTAKPVKRERTIVEVD